MNEEELKKLEQEKKLIQEVIEKELPKLLGRSLPQIKEYFITNIV